MQDIMVMILEIVVTDGLNINDFDNNIEDDHYSTTQNKLTFRLHCFALPGGELVWQQPVLQQRRVLRANNRMHSSVSHPIPLAATRNTQNTNDVGHQITGGPLYSPLPIYCPGSGGGGAGGEVVTVVVWRLSGLLVISTAT